MIYAKTTQSGKKTEESLRKMASGKLFEDLDPYGRRGVDALASATPRDTGETADSWGFQTNYKEHRYSLSWFNTHNEEGVNIAVILQYGHGTGHGGWVQGTDYINPAIKPIMDDAENDVWKKVRDA